MTSTMTNTKTRTRTRTKATVNVSKGAVLTINTIGVVIGAWALASLVGGMVVAGGPLALVKAWFGAVAGM